MKSALRNHFFLPPTAMNSNTYSRLNRHLSPDTMENSMFARFTKKSNHLKADFFITSNLVLASERTKSRKQFVVKSIDFWSIYDIRKYLSASLFSHM